MDKIDIVQLSEHFDRAGIDYVIVTTATNEKMLVVNYQKEQISMASLLDELSTDHQLLVPIAQYDEQENNAYNNRRSALSSYPFMTNKQIKKILHKSPNPKPKSRPFKGFYNKHQRNNGKK